MVEELRQDYEPSVHAPGDARQDVAEFLVAVGHGELSSVAELLASELITNSIVHAEGVVTLRASWANERLRVEVCDNGGRDSAVQSDPDVHGRGLRLVDELATDWGVHLLGSNGRETWFELE
jgi:anti-sigma regulatory factor (Ser/Thr protein kinase)